MRLSDKETMSLIKSKEAFTQFLPGKDILSRITEAELSLVQPGSTQESDVAQACLIALRISEGSKVNS